MDPVQFSLTNGSSMNESTRLNPATQCVHAGTDREALGVVTPIYPSTAFQHFDDEPQLYPRYFNIPNQQVVADKISRLEAAETGVIFSSGMAAISTTFLALLESGNHVVLTQGIYGGTHTLIVEEFERLGVDYTFVKDLDAMREAVTERTRMIYVESPTNPLLEVTDLRAVVQIAQQAEQKIFTVIDNTFATPINQTPIEMGFDVSLHSGTKYLGGHSDLCCGAVATSREIGERIHRMSCKYGGSLNATDCHLLERSLKTLELRVTRQSHNALELARYLRDLDGVGRVLFPGLPDHPGHEIAKRQMGGFGAMVTFELESGPNEAEARISNFLRRLQIIVPALSLGGVESTICVPARTSHRGMTPDQRAAAGLSDGMLRLSVGIESIQDLQDDLRNAICG